MAIAALGAWFAYQRLAPRFRARNGVERALSAFMIFCSIIAILTTLGIIVSLVYEAWAFFKLVPPHEFLFGLRWEPQIAIRADQVAGAGAFGAVPVFLGTIVIATIAMLVRGADRPLQRDLPRRVRLRPGAQGRQAGCWRSSPACRPWSTASSPS